MQVLELDSIQLYCYLTLLCLHHRSEVFPPPTRLSYRTKSISSRSLFPRLPQTDVDLTANSASSSISQTDMNDAGKAHYAQAIRQFQQYQTDWNAYDLDSAIDTGQLAVQATPEGLPDRAARCS